MTYQSVDLLVPGARVLVNDNLSGSFPANTIAYGGAWGGSWVDLGWTKETTKLAYEFEVARLKVQQTMSPVRFFKTTETAKLTTVLAEFTGQSLKYALDTGLTQVTQDVGTPGSDTVKVGGNTAMTLRRWGFEGLHVDANGNKLPLRVFFYKGVIVKGLEAEFGKEDYTGLPVEIEAAPDTTLAVGEQLFQIVKITAPGL